MSEETPDDAETTEQQAESETDWQAEAEKWKAFSRKNEDRARDNASKLSELEADRAKQAELLKTLAEKAGVHLEEEKPDARIEKLDAERRQLTIENAVIRKASALGADADALMDSRSFVNSLNKLDASSADFASQVEDAIKEANRRYKAAKPPVKQAGADFRGAPQTERQWTREEAARATPAQLSEAMDKGLLQSLGFGPRKQKSANTRNRILKK